MPQWYLLYLAQVCSASTLVLIACRGSHISSSILWECCPIT